MKTKQKSAAELAAANPNYLSWLHDLTTAGYSKRITVSTEHAEVIGLYFLEGKNVTQALEEYQRFLKRWNALTKGRNKPPFRPMGIHGRN